MWGLLKKSCFSSLLVGMLLLVLFQTAFYRPYFERMYRQEEVALTLGLNEEDLTQATDRLIAYLKDDVDSLDMVIKTQEGRLDQMFSEREKEHMVDVKNLYQFADSVMRGALIVSLISAAVLTISKQWGTARENGAALRFVLGFASIILVFIGLYAWLDFDSFWIHFHELVFSNDLWLLDPNVDRLVVMVNQNFFNGMVMRIIGALTLLFGGFVAVMLYLLNRKRD